MKENPGEELREEIFSILKESLKTRGKIALLFSGGIDSTLIALALKEKGLDFTAYTCVLVDESFKEPQDLIFAEKAAKHLGIKLRIVKIKMKELKGLLKEVVPLIDSNDVVQVGVGLTVFTACRKAKKDGMKNIVTGMGSDELFAGYGRFKGLKHEEVNKQVKIALQTLRQKDFVRDEKIIQSQGLKLIAPFLHEKMIDLALRIPAELKVSGEKNKIILRELALEKGLPEEFAWRKKKAAQYGSNIDKALGKLARQEKKTKGEFLEKFLPKKKLKLGALFSSGKDSSYALYLMQKRGFDIKCLITIKSSNPDSFMYHTPNIDLVELQAKALGLPVVWQETLGEKEKELKDLKKALEKAKAKFGIEGIVTGALQSRYQKERIERIAGELGLKVFSPLWMKDQALEMEELIKKGFKFIMTSIACAGLNKTWLGKIIDLKDLEKLKELNKKYGINIAAEGGEFESLVLDAPNFKKKLKITDSQILEENEFTAKLLIKKAELEDKEKI